jgi:hypothetical protein
MAGNLERRRQAIADALREVMSEPRPAAVPLPSLRESLTAEIDWDEAEEISIETDDVESPPIPPLEIAAAMSTTASVALFGHA